MPIDDDDVVVQGRALKAALQKPIKAQYAGILAVVCFILGAWVF